MRKPLALLLAAALLVPAGAVAFPAASAGEGPTALSVVPVSEVTSLRYSARIAQAAYSPDGLYLAIAVAAGPVFILNATTHAEVRSISTPAAWVQVSSISWGPNSDKVAVGYQAGAVAVYRIPFGPSPWFNQSLSFDVRGVAWSPDGRFLAVGIVHSIYVFWGADGTRNATLLLEYGGSQPAGLSWSRDSEYVALGQQAYSPTGAIVAIFETRTFSKALGWRWIGPGMDSVAFDGRGQFLSAQLGGSRVEVWEVRNWSLYANISGLSGIEQSAWSADGSRLVTLETEPSAAPNQTADYGGFEALRLGGGASNSSAMAASPDGRRVAVGYSDGTLRILSVGGERLFDDLTPLTATTGDPLAFSVRSTAAGLVQVTYRDSRGGPPTVASLAATGDLHTLTITVAPDWTGPLLYRFTQSANALTSPERLVRVSDNDAPVLVAWNFTRSGGLGETATATATVGDNVRLASGSFQLAVDGALAAFASAGDNQTLSFSLVVPLSPQNRSVRLELDATDTSGNGGLVFETVILLTDLIAPRFGADLSLPGTAGGRIQLGTVASDERTPPVVTVTWRELTVDGEGPWQNFTYGAPSPGTSSYVTTFPMGRSTVAVEYAFEAVDASGNRNQTATFVQSVFDREPPEIVIDLTDREAFAGDPFHLGIVVRDNVGTPSVIGYFQENGGAPVLLALTPWTPYGEGTFEGTFTVGASSTTVAYWFYITDLEDNTINSGTRTLRVKDNDAPVITVLEPTLRATAGQPYTFHVEVADPSDVGNLTVFYKRAGQATYLQEEFKPESRSSAGVPHARFSVALAALGVETYQDGRDIELHFFALDGARNAGTLGSPIDPIRIRVLDGASPVARFATAGSLFGGSLITFDGSLSSDDLGIASYEWSVDGQVVGNTTALAWTFALPGDHTVTLVVKDAADKSATQAQTLSVEAAPPQTSVAGGSSLLLAGVAAAVGLAAIGALLYLRRKKKPED